MQESEISLVEKLDDPYRMMCPERHHQLYERFDPTVYCDECGHSYRPEDLIDKTQTQSRSVVTSR